MHLENSLNNILTVISTLKSFCNNKPSAIAGIDKISS